jgi:cytolysin (calcineurin-like family phosphatase)
LNLHRAMGRAVSRRSALSVLAGGASLAVAARGWAQTPPQGGVEATFVFTNDVHACRMGDGLSPNCEEEGKTDANLLRHIAGVNNVTAYDWPAEIGGTPTGLAGAGTPIATPLGLVVGGDMTDDGGGQVATPGEGTQLRQFSQRYQQGEGPDRVRYPVYCGLGNHDLDQDGPPPHVDWYRRELRDYVEINHRSSVFFKAPVPVTSYDVPTDNYSWDWGGLHLVQTHKFAGDVSKGAIDSLPWLKDDLATYAADGRPVILFQHYGWDPFSIERWDPTEHTFDDTGAGGAHWWSEAQREALHAAIAPYNVIGIFHGHQHESALIYRSEAIDLFKPKAAYMGGLAIARVTDDFLDVVLAEVVGDAGELSFTTAFSKPITPAK